MCEWGWGWGAQREGWEDNGGCTVARLVAGLTMALPTPAQIMPSTEVPEEQSLRKLSWGGWGADLPHLNLGVGDSGHNCGWVRAAGSGAVVQ